MSNSIYSALKEMQYIINNSDIEIQEKIPDSIKKFIVDNMDKNYDVKIDFDKKISSQNLLPQTKEMMSILYRDYLCSEEDRKNIMNKMMKAQEKLEEKYDISLVFERRRKNNNIQNSYLPIEIKEKKWYEKLIEFFFKLFKRN